MEKSDERRTPTMEPKETGSIASTRNLGYAQHLGSLDKWGQVAQDLKSPFTRVRDTRGNCHPRHMVPPARAVGETDFKREGFNS